MDAAGGVGEALKSVPLAPSCDWRRPRARRLGSASLKKASLCGNGSIRLEQLWPVVFHAVDE
jgi:hypothetical protein